MDITQLILDDHHEQRRLFAILEQIDPANTAALKAVWDRLASFLEVHAEAEEQLFYPELLRVGEGVDSVDPEAETKDAIADHNDIRNAVAAVANHEAGSAGWYDAIAKANEANSDHMAEEEREGLTDFRRHAELQLRHDLAVAFAKFEATHFAGVTAV
nr:hemerythrin domain-containing protein [Actinomycetota bacterium]